MTLRIVKANMFKLSRLLERRDLPVQVPQPAVDSWESGADIAEVALEVLDVDGVEADDGGVETDIGFCDVGAVVERVVLGLHSCEVGFDFVEVGEEGCDGFVVGFLGCCEAGAVDAVVDVVVGPVVCGFDFAVQAWWEGVDGLVGVWEEVVELVI